MNVKINFIMRRVVHLLAVLVLLFAEFATAEHHHEDHHLHIDCSLCILQYASFDSPHYTPEIKLRVVSFYVSYSEEPLQPHFRPQVKTGYCRAPPA